MTRIMIVEDERDVADYLRLTLTKAGYEATQHHCLRDAMADQDRYDLIVLDLALPDVKGDWDALVALRGRYLDPFIPIMIFSARSMIAGDGEKAARLGATDVFTKSSSMYADTFLRHVSVALNRRYRNCEVAEMKKTLDDVSGQLKTVPPK